MSSELKQAFQMLSILKMVAPLKDFFTTMPSPEQSYCETEPKEIEVQGKKLFVVVSKIAYTDIKQAKKLIEFYNNLDEVLRKLAK